MATPLMGSVPTCPTMTLSRRLTKLVMTLWIKIGSMTEKSRL